VRKEIEIDIVALNEDTRVILFDLKEIEKYLKSYSADKKLLTTDYTD
jgi:hypothetical protein